MSGEPSRVCVLGATGRMGAAIARLCLKAEDLQLVGATVRPGSPRAGEDIGGVALQEDLGSALMGADVLIDFTSPEATASAARLAGRSGVALIVGTTGLDEAAERELERAAQRVPVVVAPNMSLGVNLLLALVRQASAAVPGWDAELFEIHHRHKKDAPSGTALALGRALASGRGLNADEVRVSARDGVIGARSDDEIGVMALRGGDVVGEHSVMLFGEGERLELGHKATDRDIFARGALRAASWVAGKTPGRYTMADVLGLS